MQRAISARAPLSEAPTAMGQTLLAEEDVLEAAVAWMQEGQRVVLVTLVGVEGGAPRQLGAQMAVSEDGRYAGYLSGGCLEQAVVLEAQDAIAKDENRLVRYGRGSKYVDIRLPCGSGLDVYFDQGLGVEAFAALIAHRRDRTPVLLRTDLASGRSAVEPAGERPLDAGSTRDGDVFERLYLPPLRLLLIGAGPAMTGLAALASTVGLELKLVAADDATASTLAPLGIPVAMLETKKLAEDVAWLDAFSGAALLFHDHEREPAILREILRTESFYIGVLGNYAARRAREEMLKSQGVAASDLARIRAPVGSISGAKSKATLAVGVLAELLAEAKARNLVA